MAAVGSFICNVPEYSTVGRLPYDFDVERHELREGGQRFTCGPCWVEVRPDHDPLNPRDDWDCFISRFATFHGSYDLGDADTVDGWRECETAADVCKWAADNYGATVVLPLFLLDHSGLSIRAGDSMDRLASTNRFVGDEGGWDTSAIGFVFDDADRCKRAGWEVSNGPVENTVAQLRGDVEVFDQYLTGDVYVIDAPEPEGACGGFYGYDSAENHALDELRSQWWALVRDHAAAMDWARTMSRAITAAGGAG